MEMAKKARYSKKIVDDVVALIKEDSYTVAEICQKVGISERSYYNWRNKHAEFAEAIKEAEEEFTQDVLVECKKSLRKLITGYSIKERKTVMADSRKKDKNGNPIPTVKEQTITDKHYQPNLGAIIHFQTNRDPDNWKNKHSTEVTGKDGKDLIPQMDFKDFTDEELKTYYQLLAKANGK